MKIIAHIECGNDGNYSVYFNEDLPFGCFGEGRTADEAKNDFLGTFEAFRRDHFQHTGENIEKIKTSVISFAEELKHAMA